MSGDDYHVEDIELGKYTVQVYRDESPENPYEAWDCFSTYAGVIDRGGQVGKGWEELPGDWIEDEDDENYGEPIYPSDIEGLRKFCSEYKGVIAIPYSSGYYGEISECSVDRADGFVFATSAMIEKEYGDLSQKSVQRAISLLQSEFNTFQAWSEGNVYGYRILKTSDLEDDDDPEEVEDGSCWGFYGEDYWDNGLYDSVGDVIGHELIPPKKESRLPILPKVNTANGCYSCFLYCFKAIKKSAERAAARQLQPAYS